VSADIIPIQSLWDIYAALSRQAADNPRLAADPELIASPASALIVAGLRPSTHRTPHEPLVPHVRRGSGQRRRSSVCPAMTSKHG
jgi:hypothetical protein